MSNVELGNSGRKLAEAISSRQIKGFAPIHWGLVQEFLHYPNQPEVITDVWRALLPDVSTPDCRWTEAKIAERIPGIKGGTSGSLMVPEVAEFRGSNGLVRLVMRFSLVDKSNVTRLRSVESDATPHDYVKIEADVNAPNLHTTVDELRAFFAATGRVGITEQVYILGALFSKKMLTGAYFDEFGTITDIDGSRDTNDADPDARIRAWFEYNGKMKTALPHRPHDDHQPFVGRRTMELPHLA